MKPLGSVSVSVRNLGTIYNPLYCDGHDDYEHIVPVWTITSANPVEAVIVLAAARHQEEVESRVDAAEKRYHWEQGM